MSVCQFYLRGNCRFGNRCRLPHGNEQYRPQHPSQPPFRPRFPRLPINPEYRYHAPSATHQHPSTRENYQYADVFRWVAETFGSKKEKALDILQQLQKEAKVWQKSSSLWRFTSRSLFPGGQPLPDWHDQSFEEVKWAHRQMSNANQEHNYKKAYNDYFTNTERYLNGLARLNLDILKPLKDYIQQYVDSPYQPSSILLSDIEMQDGTGITITTFTPSTESRNYTPDDQLLEDERAAFESDTFEFGQIPMHAPSKQFC